MVANGRKRSRGVLVPFLLLVLLTSWATRVTKVVIIFGHRVPSLRQAEVNQLFHTLLVGYVVILIGVITIKKWTNESSMARKATVLGIV